MPEIRIESKTDEQTGTRRVYLWSENAETGGYGDIARGTAYSSLYAPDSKSGAYAEVAIYPILCADGGYGVEERVEIGKLAFNDDGSILPDDAADITYDWASALAFQSLEDAQAEADRLGQADQSCYLYLKP